MIIFDNVSYLYHNNKDNNLFSLKNINIDIHNGDFIAVIGANGSGKSTFAKHINGLLLPQEGDVIVNNMNTKDTDKIWEIRKKVGMVFQNPDNQLVATTIEDDIAFGLENVGIDESEMKERVEWALDLVGMLEMRNCEPHLLSGGQKQKVVIAGALAMHTSYLVLDEPTSMLDPKGRREILDTIKKLNRDEKITIIYITHFMSEAAEFNKIIVLKRGEIALTGTPQKIFLQSDEQLKQLNLELPPTTMLARMLSQKGIKIPPNILNKEEMVEKLCLLI
ncbi:MAG: energy-coupling factor transporter ATPase [Candidatus Caldatribacteriota bacterium]|nr:energy-coupling factor transporter ATPase [Atribacterota bacterium]MDD3640692.1 energy-coupling factor transporter ATPase [Atribacterota bacterium]MDD4288474.1 energy-coupling factor transporter ATPase [Atribacterota bacterium]MDD4764307.1 energy-coupling factor transporter ATPase [Atribacterota bacterium]MDD5635302.1 energy-coupling factor transporter ATPase [Atribacterota bacterium]